MAIQMTQKEYEEFIRNGGQARNVVDKRAKPSFLSNLVQSLTKPVRVGVGLAEDTLDRYRTASHLLQNSPTAVAEYNALRAPHKLAMLDEAESAEVLNDPVKAGTKAIAGVGSYFVPVGEGANLANAVKLGTTSGLLGGYGYSREGKELGDTLAGGAFGAGTGALSHWLQNLKVKTKAKRPKVDSKTYARSVLGYDADSIMSSRTNPYKGNISRATEMSRRLDKYLYKAKSPREALTLADQALDDTAQKISKILNKPENAKINMLDSFGQNIQDVAEQFASEKTALRTAKNRIQSQLAGVKGGEQAAEIFDLFFTPENVSEQVARRVAQSHMTPQEYQDVLRSVNKMLSASTMNRNEVPAVKDIIRTFQRKMSEALKEKVNGIEPLLADQTALMSVTDEIAKRAKGATTMRSMGTRVKVPDLTSPVVSKLGKTYAKIADATEGLQNKVSGENLSAILNKLGKETTQAPRTTGAFMSLRNAKAKEALLNGNIKPVVNDLQKGVPHTNSSQSVFEAIDSTKMQRDADRAEMFNQLVAEGYKPTDAQRIVNMNLPEYKAWKPTQADAHVMSALEAVDTMEDVWKGKTMGDKIASILPYGGLSDKGKEIAQARKIVYNTVARLESGAAIPKEEVKFFLSLVPDVTDDEEMAQMKLEQLKQYLLARIALPDYARQ